MKFIRLIITCALITVLMVTLVVAKDLPPWAYMWAIAFAMYFNFKWITLAFSKNVDLFSKVSMIYLFAWVGMDPAPFQNWATRDSVWDSSLFVKGLRNILFGLALIYSIGYFEIHWLIQSWLVCGGMAMVLHFGVFHWLAWFWRGVGYKVEPIMKFPLATKTIAEFWGGRWNIAFNQLVQPFLFQPLKKKLGPLWGVLGTFFVSGVIHELAISLPANAGWGLPTLYFLIQAFGMFIERLKLAWLPQRFFTYLVLIGPAFILFHPPFMKTVILPLASVLGAII